MDVLTIAAAGAASMFDGLGWFADESDSGKEIVCKYADEMEFRWTFSPRTDPATVFVTTLVTVSSGSRLPLEVRA